MSAAEINSLRRGRKTMREVQARWPVHAPALLHDDVVVSRDGYIVFSPELIEFMDSELQRRFGSCVQVA